MSKTLDIYTWRPNLIYKERVVKNVNITEGILDNDDSDMVLYIEFEDGHSIRYYGKRAQHELGLLLEVYDSIPKIEDGIHLN